MKNYNINQFKTSSTAKTYPNQRMVKIHRENATRDFLGIKNENWQAASRDLGAHALRLYLYFASNADNFQLALSPQAIMNEVGIPRSTYHDQFKKLLANGYIQQTGKNSFEFFETPQPRTDKQEENQKFSDGLPNPSDVNNISTDDNIIPSDDIEINNTNIIDNKINIENNNQQEALYPKETIIRITSPKAEGKNRPQYRPKEKQFFNF